MPAHHSDPLALEGLRVLLVEDNVVNRKVALNVLRKRRHHVTVATNGREALTAYDHARFDLILMDLQMPEMDGLEATAAIRARERERGGHVPIVAMTAHVMTGDREMCLDAGMDGYVAKPIRGDDLLAAIDAAVRPFVEPGEDAPFDPRRMVSALREDDELLRDLAALFVHDGPQAVPALRHAARARDLGEATRAARRLRNALTVFAARPALAALAALDRAVREGDGEGLDPAADELGREVDRLCDGLRRFVARAPRAPERTEPAAISGDAGLQPCRDHP